MILYLKLYRTPCAVVMMPIPRCQNPVMKWISREEKEEKVPPTDTLMEREKEKEGEISCWERKRPNAGGGEE